MTFEDHVEIHGPFFILHGLIVHERGLVCPAYSRFSRIIEGRIEGLVFLITEERAYLRRQEIGDLGVRVQVSGTGDVVGNTVANDEMIRIAIETCCFLDEMLNGSDYEDEIIEDAYAMKKMRKDYKLFNSMLGVLESVNWAVDYIITHTAPEDTMSIFHPEHTYEMPLNGFLEYIREKVSYSHWYMGHLHRDEDVWRHQTVLLFSMRNMENNTEFELCVDTCLGIYLSRNVVSRNF